MKYLLLTISLIILSIVTPAYSQVTNLVVSGTNAPARFSFVSGNSISWSYTIPTGTTTVIEIRLDVNGNGTIEPGTDKVFTTFAQTDGDTAGNGPPDMDGLVNGAVSFS